MCWGEGFDAASAHDEDVAGRGGHLERVDRERGDLCAGQLDDLAKLNEMKLAEHGDPEIATRIAQYEMAYRMQSSVPELADLSNEDRATRELYGIDEAGDDGGRLLAGEPLQEAGDRVEQPQAGHVDAAWVVRKLLRSGSVA